VGPEFKEAVAARVEELRRWEINRADERRPIATGSGGNSPERIDMDEARHQLEVDAANKRNDADKALEKAVARAAKANGMTDEEASMVQKTIIKLADKLAPDAKVAQDTAEKYAEDLKRREYKRATDPDRPQTMSQRSR
jgi:hypothetical protein